MAAADGETHVKIQIPVELIAWLSAIGLAAWGSAGMPLIIGLLVVLLAGFPLWISHSYSSSTQRQHNLSALYVPRWWHGAGHWVQTLGWALAALWFGIVVVADLVF